MRWKNKNRNKVWWRWLGLSCPSKHFLYFWLVLINCTKIRRLSLHPNEPGSVFYWREHNFMKVCTKMLVKKKRDQIVSFLIFVLKTNQTVEESENNAEKYRPLRPAQQNVFISRAHISTHVFGFLFNVLKCSIFRNIFSQ